MREIAKDHCEFLNGGSGNESAKNVRAYDDALKGESHEIGIYALSAGKGEGGDLQL